MVKKNDLVDICVQMGDDDNPMYVNFGITKEQQTRFRKLLEKEGKHISRKRWNELFFQATKKED